MGRPAWGLEVVKGREPGRVFPVPEGASVLGNALNGEPGIDLGPQEAQSPRRMAARQAVIDSNKNGLALRDLDSPGGTFLNRQRLLSGQGRPLQDGDVIQVGGVQLKVVEIKLATVATTPAPAPVVSTGPLRAPFRMANGDVCRTWDDFLGATSKSWTALRDELATGRLGAFLKAQGRSDLAPIPPRPGLTDDDRLDDWLSRLPATRPARAEMEVHPGVVRVKGSRGGGASRLAIRVTNVGYRLLRSSVRVEPADADWIRVGPPFAPGPFTTAEETEVPVEVVIPEGLTAPKIGELWVEGNGGSRRVEVRIEPQRSADVVPESPAVSVSAPGPLAVWFRGLSPGARLAAFAAAGLAVRVAVAVGDLLSSGLPINEMESPSLAGTMVVLGAFGGVVGVAYALRRGEARDLPASLAAGAIGGGLLATVVVAACRSVEPMLGPLSGSLLGALALWGVLGAGASALFHRRWGTGT